MAQRLRFRPRAGQDAKLRLLAHAILDVPYYFMVERELEGMRMGISHGLHGRARLRALPARRQPRRAQALGATTCPAELAERVLDLRAREAELAAQL